MATGTRTKTYRYYVTGFGQFPDDMLRYDRATVKASHTFDRRTFYLIEGQSSPTRGRWSSFLWNVIETPAELERWPELAKIEGRV